MQLLLSHMIDVVNVWKLLFFIFDTVLNVSWQFHYCNNGTDHIKNRTFLYDYLLRDFFRPTIQYKEAGMQPRNKLRYSWAQRSRRSNGAKSQNWRPRSGLVWGEKCESGAWLTSAAPAAEEKTIHVGWSDDKCHNTGQRSIKSGGCKMT